jgi:hypothetical protein
MGTDASSQVCCRKKTTMLDNRYGTSDCRGLRSLKNNILNDINAIVEKTLDDAEIRNLGQTRLYSQL